jgi:hypothetical protein
VFLATFGPNAVVDSTALSVTGMVTSCSVNGVQLGAGNYTAQQLVAAGYAVGTWPRDRLPN